MSADPRAWCDRCERWTPCPCGCGHGWCDAQGEMLAPEPGVECFGFRGEWPEICNCDELAVDQLREDGI